MNMAGQEIRIRAYREMDNPLSDYAAFLQIAQIMRHEDGRPQVVARCVDMTFKKPMPGETFEDRSCRPGLTHEAAQQLMDDLWRCGLRPTEGQGSAGQRAALEAHLRDVRAIAFKKLGMEAPS